MEALLRLTPLDSIATISIVTRENLQKKLNEYPLLKLTSLVPHVAKCMKFWMRAPMMGCVDAFLILFAAKA